MFETSMVRAHAQAASGRFSLLTLSVIAHSAVIVGVVAFSIASVDFPVTAPDAYEDAPFFVPVTVPPPLGNSDRGRQVQPQQPRATTPPSRPTDVTAPTEVSNDVTPVEAPSSNVTSDATGPATSGPETPGVPWGTANSVGPIDGPPVVDSTPPVEERIYQPYEVKAPVLLRKVDPTYPSVFMHAGVAATVVLRCVIDKNGQVRSPEVVSSGMKPFDDAVIAAVQQWRYTPASLRGVAVDSYLDVTVRFTVRR